LKLFSVSFTKTFHICSGVARVYAARAGPD